MKNNEIIITKAAEQNLKNVSVTIPKEKLVVITGLSGSGKSSLAFNTLYEEGKRRYLESLSSYARMFLGGGEKPKVQSIEGLCPAIAINQKSTSHNPRSTVGTVTEIYDYLRLLFANIGKPYCPHGHGLIESLTTKQIKDKIVNELKEDEKFQILAPLVVKEKGTFADLFEKLKSQGFMRVNIDDSEYKLDEEIKLDKNKFHTIYLIIDRIVYHDDEETNNRILSSITTSLEKANGVVAIKKNDQLLTYSNSHTCKVCGFSIPEIDNRLFSFNNPIGACNHCKGLGFTFEFDEAKIIPDPSMTINEGGIDFFKNSVGTQSLDWMAFDNLLKHYKISKDIPIKDLTKEQLDIIYHGSKEKIEYTIVSKSGNTFTRCDTIEGIVDLIKRRHNETTSEMAREYYNKYLTEKTCPICHGKKLNEMALSIKIHDHDIIDLTELNIIKLLEFFNNLKLTGDDKKLGEDIIIEIINRLTFLNNVGLSYLSLSRNANTLSGGEAQRIRLATQIGSKLTGILYVLDEPSIGLHQKDNSLLIKSLKQIRDLSNTVVVVEHDTETIEAADYLIEIGPGAGKYGGEIVFAGETADILNCKKSITGKYLNGELSIPVPTTRRSGSGKNIILKGAKENNLKNIELNIPLGKIVAITGVSGSGKSTLINEVLIKNIEKLVSNPFISAPKITSLVGANQIKKIISISQEPIGRTPHSNPATYIGLFDDIRELYSQLPEAKSIGLTKSSFSFNRPGGRCEKCWGYGTIKKEMHFMPDIYITCDECNGKRYNEQVLSIKYKNKNIHDVLSMSVDEACEFFASFPNIRHKLELLQDVGLGYIDVGLPSDKLSGGEAQRIKLAKFLQKPTDEKTILVMDEPTTGLHIDDIKKLLKVINRIADRKTTVIIIEHNLDLIKCADYIIDLGPDGGDFGGEIVATGTPEQLCEKDDVSYTAKYLKKMLAKEKKK